MRRFLCAAAVLTVALIVSFADAVSLAPYIVSGVSRIPATSVASASKQTPAQAPGAAAASNRMNPASYQGTLNRYCFPCHNQRVPTPAGSPLILDTANESIEESALAIVRLYTERLEQAS